MSRSPRTVLVTGATRGIGRAIALELARLGDCELLLVYRADESAAAETLRLLGGYPVKARCIRCDIADPAQVRGLTQRLSNECSRLDVLVNNAGITRDTAFATQPLGDIRTVLRTNLRSTIALTLNLMPLLLRSRTPTIINVSSLAGVVGKEGQAAYGASKGGMIGFAQLMASSFRDQGLVINTVVPGFIRTDMVKDLLPEMYEHVLEGTALRRMGEPEEVGAAVAFLATTASRYLNAVALKVDGGFHR